jgi:hypothetical protein
MTGSTRITGNIGIFGKVSCGVKKTNPLEHDAIRQHWNAS